jgi:hypothetical protein
MGSFELQINSDSYWHMYKNAIVLPEAQDTMPTRTIVYTGASVKIIVFHDTTLIRSFEPLFADRFSLQQKGQQGIHKAGTLRGDLVFSEAVTLGFNTLHNPVIQMACDPLGAYRHKIANYCMSAITPHKHIRAKNQLLQYTGVGIHVPDSTEFVNDICSLLSWKQIKSLVK